MHAMKLRSCLAALLLPLLACGATASERVRLLIETDAGGDPDDEQSLVRFLLYANEWDVEGIIANRPHARSGENRNPERTGLGIVRRQLEAYGICWTNLVLHDARYPRKEFLWERTVAGYNETDEGAQRIIAAVDKDDARPLWYSDWGTDHGAATNNLRRALDRIRAERGAEGAATMVPPFFGDHRASWRVRPAARRLNRARPARCALSHEYDALAEGR
jgi:hypothetical protein